MKQITVKELFKLLSKETFDVKNTKVFFGVQPVFGAKLVDGKCVLLGEADVPPEDVEEPDTF